MQHSKKLHSEFPNLGNKVKIAQIHVQSFPLNDNSIILSKSIGFKLDFTNFYFLFTHHSPDIPTDCLLVATEILRSRMEIEEIFYIALLEKLQNVAVENPSPLIRVPMMRVLVAAVEQAPTSFLVDENLLESILVIFMADQATFSDACQFFSLLFEREDADTLISQVIISFIITIPEFIPYPIQLWKLMCQFFARFFPIH